jgi:hypothetical protein
MRRNGLFLGVFVILLGLVLLAINLGYVTARVWNFFWPAVLILLGAWFLWRPKLRQGTPLPVEHASFPLGSADEAAISIHHGAGKLNLHASSQPGELAGGTFAGGVQANQSMQGSKAVLEVRNPTMHIYGDSWVGNGRGFEWNVGINSTVPMDLELHTGANELLLDLTETQIRNLLLETGASRSVITLPKSAGFTRATFKSGLAETVITVPEGVAALIDVKSGLSGIKVNEQRFPRVGEVYQSADYQTSANRVEIHVETGLGSVTIQ